MGAGGPVEDVDFVSRSPVNRSFTELIDVNEGSCRGIGFDGRDNLGSGCFFVDELLFPHLAGRSKQEREGGQAE